MEGYILASISGAFELITDHATHDCQLSKGGGRLSGKQYVSRTQFLEVGMKIKTSELTNAALAYAVGVADKRIMRNGIGGSIEVRGRTEDGEELPDGWDMWMLWYPQTDWSQAGPIIERERIQVFPHNGATEWCGVTHVQRDGYIAILTQDGPTPLIAAMRCLVTSKLGDEVEIPEELFCNT